MKFAMNIKLSPLHLFELSTVSECIFTIFQSSNPTKPKLAHSLMGCLNSEIDALLNAAENMRSIISTYWILGMFDTVRIFD